MRLSVLSAQDCGAALRFAGASRPFATLETVDNRKRGLLRRFGFGLVDGRRLWNREFGAQL